MFTRVIIATDLSEASDQIVVNLTGLTALGTREVILAHAMDIAPQSISTPGFDYNEALRGDLSRRAQARLGKLRDVVGAQGFEASARIIYGTPAAALDALARSAQASLVIVGSRGSSLARNIMLGGNALDILQHSRVPVLLKRLIRNEAGATSQYRLLCRDFPNHLLFPTDFSATAERAFQVVQSIVDRCGSSVTLLHIEAANDPHRSDTTRARLEEKAAALRKGGAAEVIVKLKTGNPAEEIARATMVGGVSLLVLGTQGHGFIDQLFLGSTCRELVGTAAVPILTIPPEPVGSILGVPAAAAAIINPEKTDLSAHSA
jgi:nucleotide-binding universal stress UspA family protein